MKTKQIGLSADKWVWIAGIYAIKGLKLRIYWCLYSLSATITVMSWVIPARSRSAWSVFSFCVLRPATQKLFLKWLIDFSTFYSDFIGGIPFICTADCTRIGTKILFRINVNHSSTGRSGTWMITVAYAFRFLCGAVPFPFHFGAYEFYGRKAAAQMGFASFTLQ